MTKEQEEEMITAALQAFNGGLVDVPSKRNGRGYVTMYLPRKAMRKALVTANILKE